MTKSTIRRAFAFPGQGGQGPEMAKALVSGSEAARRTFDAISQIIGKDVLKLCADKKGLLTDTRIIQMAVFAVSAAALVALREEKGIDADFFIGHSQGEPVAFHAAGAYDLETATGIIHERGEAMHEAGLANPGGMFVANRRPIEELHAIATESGAQLANVNSLVEGNEQVVYTGGNEEIDSVQSAFDPDDKRSFRLPIPIPAHHSIKMMVAGERLGRYVESVKGKFHDLRPTVPNNIPEGGDPSLIETAEAAAVQIPGQMTRGVNYADGARVLVEELGVTEIVEVGAGSVLTGLHKRYIKSIDGLSDRVRAISFGDKLDTI